MEERKLEEKKIRSDISKSRKRREKLHSYRRAGANKTPFGIQAGNEP